MFRSASQKTKSSLCSDQFSFHRWFRRLLFYFWLLLSIILLRFLCFLHWILLLLLCRSLRFRLCQRFWKLCHRICLSCDRCSRRLALAAPGFFEEGILLHTSERADFGLEALILNCLLFCPLLALEKVFEPLQIESTVWRNPALCVYETSTCAATIVICHYAENIVFVVYYVQPV